MAHHGRLAIFYSHFSPLRYSTSHRMPRFFTGDELGSVKSIRYAQDVESKQWKPEVTVLSGDSSAGRVKAIQKLVMHGEDEDNTLVGLNHCRIQAEY